jgi:hypothetical protein
MAAAKVIVTLLTVSQRANTMKQTQGNIIRRSPPGWKSIHQL